MTKPPKSPSEGPASSHSRRPSASRRASANEISMRSPSSSKHALKSAPHAPTKKAHPTMSASPTTAETTSSSSRQKEAAAAAYQHDRRQSTGRAGHGPASAARVEPSGDGHVEEVTAQEPGRWRQDVRGTNVRTSSSTPSEEIDRLRAAMNAQLSLSQQRERLAKRPSEKKPEGLQDPPVTRNSRASPVHEKLARSPTSIAASQGSGESGPQTASTEFKTVWTEPTLSVSVAPSPSYPFPTMKSPSQVGSAVHRSLETLSPNVADSAVNFPAYTQRDSRTSGPETPSSSSTPKRSLSYQDANNPDFPSPDINEISLWLSAEPGLDAWWTIVVHVMRDIFRAERVTLAVPADSTDVENIPWGQKATFNAAEEDKLSLTYLPRGSSYAPSSGGEGSFLGSSNAPSESPANLSQPVPHSRPGLQSRHSFTAYEERIRASASLSEDAQGNTTRPTSVSRSKSYFETRSVDEIPQPVTQQSAELSVESLEKFSTLGDTKMPTNWDIPDIKSRDISSRIFPVLQALDYEADPLIDTRGVLRVLKRGKVTVLTRDYPYLTDPETEPVGKKSRRLPAEKGKQAQTSKTTDMISRMSTLLRHPSSCGPQEHRGSGVAASPGASFGDGRPPLRCDEYEQSPQSPWEQSPAPSPAVRAESDDNPFFATAARIDTASFDPAPVRTDYVSSQKLEAIAIDRSFTVVHVPLDHMLLSKPVQSFRLDTAALESRTANRVVHKDTATDTNVSAITGAESKKAKLRRQGADPVATQQKKSLRAKRTPIAILSFISPVIPYPANLQHSLEKLAPHLATSFNLCRHHANLEAEIAGLSRKRPHATGFGAVGWSPNVTGNSANMIYSVHEDERPNPGGSITSPSDYSALSRSTAGSPAVTPGLEPGSMGLTIDRRFTGGSPGVPGTSNEGYFSTRRRPTSVRVDTASGMNVAGARRPSISSSEARQSYGRQHEEGQSYDQVELGNRQDSCDTLKVRAEQQKIDEGSVAASQQKHIRRSCDMTSEFLDAQGPVPSQRPVDPVRRQAIRTASAQGPILRERVHTKLHSGGADLGVTFPSIPGSMDMLPPSDRLKTLMLDTLPVHVFVATPRTGEVIWVNNSFLTYRGQTVSQLYDDAWGSIYPDEREAYIAAWSTSIRTGQPFSRQVRVRRFDGNYRWFYARAVAGKDTKNVIVQWYGSFMDIHDQHVAEVEAARREEMEASEANYRLLSNLIPQIIFAASEETGVIFANEQWLTYTGQEYRDALGTGFLDYVHPEDLEKCHIPFIQPGKGKLEPSRQPSGSSLGGESSKSNQSSSDLSETSTQSTAKAADETLSRTKSSSSSKYELSGVDLAQLASSGVIKVSMDSNGRQSYTTEVRLRSRAGEYRWHLVRCVEVDGIKFGNGEGSWFGACTDINDHKLLESKLKEAMESKSKFLSNMSHEIRTPLIGISGMVDFLQDTVLNEEQLDYAGTIKTSASSLLSIINDILDLSKVDAGMMKLSFEWFHTRSLIEEANELLSTMAIQKRLELNYVVEEDVPAMVKGDKIRIRQVLLNIIGNAIKFTSEGEVFSRCRVYRDPSLSLGKDEIMLEYMIVDTGRGFTAEEAELIFKPFSQIDGSSTRQHGGSGLGLVISRQLVELHGGRMSGSAMPDKGSTFTFTARFGLPTLADHPVAPRTPALGCTSTSSVPLEVSAQAVKMAGGSPILAQKLLGSPSQISPRTDPNTDSLAVDSSASSDPSIRSTHTYNTSISSFSSIHSGLASFSDAARASGQDLSNLKLVPPEGRLGSADIVPIREDIEENSRPSSSMKRFRPPIYSILVICPQTHSREATTSHIEQTLPKDIPHQITAMASVAESQRLIGGGDDPVFFTHIVLNLGSPEEVVTMMDHILGSALLPHTSIVILSDPIQRQAVLKMATTYDYDQLAKENRVTFIYKPVKPSRFAVIFDPEKERDLSTDRSRSNVQQQAADQKQNYLDMEKRFGNKGHRILLVEDNPVNRKVLIKFLQKIGIEVDTAFDGVECTDKVFSHPHGFYSLILVSCVYHLR